MDTHFYEPDDCFSRHIESKYRDFALVPKEVEGGLRTWFMGDRSVSFPPPGVPLDLILPPGSFAGLFSEAKEGSMKEFDLLRDAIRPSDVPEFFERGARLKLMEQQGIEACLILPSYGMVVGYDFLDRPDALCANYRAFNYWQEEEWGYGADGRIFAVPLFTLVDREWAVEELERVANLGSRFAVITHGPINGRSPADPFFDPFWARVQESGITPVFHIGYEGFAHHYAAQWGEDPNRTISRYSAFQLHLSFGERPIQDHMAALVLHNLFGRFPGIEVLIVELGSEWVAPLLKSMDKAARMGARGESLGGKLPDLPSEMFKNHVHVVPFPEDDINSIVNAIGVERVLFGSDYPHPEGIAEPLEFAAQIHLDQFPRSDIRKIMHDNGAALLGLQTSTPQ